MSNTFAHIHLHTDFSMLDGLGKPVVYVNEAHKRGEKFLGITDHGTLSGVYEFYMACKDTGIGPVLGCELYFVPSATKVKEEKSGERFHVVFIARNAAGFRTLCELVSEAHRHFYYKPVIDRKMIKALGKDRDNIVVLTGCAASIIARKALNGSYEEATEELLWWRRMFRHCFVEIQHHGTDIDRKLNIRLLKLAREHNLPWVATNDPHYVTKEEDECHDALLAIQTAADMDDPDRFRFSGSGYHLRSRQEMVRAFARYGRDVWEPGIRQANVIARNCAVSIPEWDSRSWHIPKYRRLPENRSSLALLTRLTRKGLREKGLWSDATYRNRAKWELEQIGSIEGFADFLLITREIIQWAVKRGIWVGPGRGSTAGCLVGYLIGVHKVDSIRYKLKFERFLNPARPKMPDIDTDFSQLRRDEVIEHTYDEYGRENVLPVAAFQTLRVRGAFRKLATSMGMPFTDLSKFSQMLAEAWGTEDDEDDEEEEHIRTDDLPSELVEAYPDLVQFIEGIHGTKSAISRHPAGVLIFDPDDEIRRVIPEMWIASSKRFAAMYDLKSAEKMGLMKQDFLGLRTGDTIQECVKLVKERHGVELDPDSWIPDEEEDDDKVYRMLASGRLAGVFQLEGDTMVSATPTVKPRCFEDIVTTTALWRKGPMMAGADKRFLANRKAKQVKVLHKSLRPILQDTWGEMAYQEQMMEIASECAGFDQAGVADLLAAVRFKDPEMMEPLRERFVKGCVENTGMTTKTANAIWKMMEAQSAYLFNRCHAVAYSLITYQTARLKYLYPLEFFTALMRTVKPKNDKDKHKRVMYCSEAVDMGIEILPPEINQSGPNMTCGGSVEDGNAWMRFGFIDVKEIGESAVVKIVAAREADNVYGFYGMDDVEDTLPLGITDRLDAAGVFSEIGGAKRNWRALEALVGWQFHDAMAPVRERYAQKTKLPKRTQTSNVAIPGEIIDIERKKTKTNKPYIVWRLRHSPAETFTCMVWDSAYQLHKVRRGTIVFVKGKYQSEYKNISVNDESQVRIISTKEVEETSGHVA